MTARRTIIVAGRTAAAAMRLHAARQGWQGVEIRTIEQVAARLAGGFLQPIDGDALADACGKVVAESTAAELGDLQRIADLPGLPRALASTLSKLWQAHPGRNAPAAVAGGEPRLRIIHGLEAAVLRHLPPNMLRPVDLVSRACQTIVRLNGPQSILGEIELGPHLDIAPCWQLLVLLLHRPGGLHWQAGPYEIPAWWNSTCGDRLYLDEHVPERRTVTCATARHEVIEAMRWARSLLASGVEAPDIAFAAASPGEYDDLVLATAEEASLPVHFAHGRRALTTRDGQAAASLADLLLRGLSRERVRRLARLAHAEDTPFGRLPRDWDRHLPAAPLATLENWRQALGAARERHLEEGGDGSEARPIADILLPAIGMLADGPDRAVEAGALFLRGGARLLWRRALARAPASALETSLAALRLPDEADPATSIGWMHASALATSPRAHVWLLGLNARSWPRASREDPLLPEHVVPAADLDPMSVTRMDRLAFRAIAGTTARALVCSASRRDATGRRLGLSPLLPAGVEPEHLRRNRVPGHAMSEQDRLMARPHEFAGTARAGSAHGCWNDWHDPAITAHDGLVRPDHPVLAAALGRVHSASSLRLLLRNPLGFTWRYALGWRQPDGDGGSMDLDPIAFGSLVHEILDAALPAVEAAGGIGRATSTAVAAAVDAARATVATTWEASQPVPPALLWGIRLREAGAMAVTALCWTLPATPGQTSHGEVAFGDPDATPGDAPWDASRPVTIPGTDLRIRGRIDRLDLAADRSQARVVDYKTGKPRDPGALDRGRELQRCLYAYAARALLGPEVTVEAALLYPRGEAALYAPLEDTVAALEALTRALLAARESLRAGRALPGVDAGDTYDEFALALPAGPAALTARKKQAAAQQLGDAAAIWEQA